MEIREFLLEIPLNYRSLEERKENEATQITAVFAAMRYIKFWVDVGAMGDRPSRCTAQYRELL